MLKKLWAPERNFSEILHLKKKHNFMYAANTPCHAPYKSCDHITVRCEHNADCSGDLRPGRTTVYSKKPSSMATTRSDVENQVFLATHCDCLQGQFLSPHSLSVNGSSSIAPGETIRSRHFVLRHKVANTP